MCILQKQNMQKSSITN